MSSLRCSHLAWSGYCVVAESCEPANDQSQKSVTGNIGKTLHEDGIRFEKRVKLDFSLFMFQERRRQVMINAPFNGPT